MIGLEIIKRIKEYLDYLEEHLGYVNKACNEVTKKCAPGLKNSAFWSEVESQVAEHDLSKFSAEEFTQYRGYFFPAYGEESEGPDAFNEAWEHHKECNSHHWESLETETDVAHMVIDWTAMGYKFGDTAEIYYNKNKDRICIPENLKPFFDEMMERL